MNPIFQTLLRKCERELIGCLSIDPRQINSMLDQRDRLRWDWWMAAYEEIENMKSRSDWSVAEERLSSELREKAFLAVMDRWKSSDLAGYASDDFGLIGDALLVGYENPLVAALYADYLRGVFPCSTLSPATSSLADLVTAGAD